MGGCRRLRAACRRHRDLLRDPPDARRGARPAFAGTHAMTALPPQRLSHLKQLEAESIPIIREVAAEFARPVLLYSIGKDSQVLLHLARKAFPPAPLPFPLLHVDTTWK